MKHLLFISILWAMFGPFCNAQKIEFRKETDNTLHIGTNYLYDHHLFDYSRGIALSALIDKATKEADYEISLYFEFKDRNITQKNSRAIFQTSTGKIVTLFQNKDVHCQRSMNHFSMASSYYIAYKDLYILMTEDIINVRIESFKGLLDFSYKSDVLSSFLRAEFNLISNRIDFTNNF